MRNEFLNILKYSQWQKAPIICPKDVSSGEKITGKTWEEAACLLGLLEEERTSIRKCIHCDKNAAQSIPRFHNGVNFENDNYKVVDTKLRNIICSIESGKIKADDINAIQDMAKWITDDLDDILTSEKKQFDQTKILEIQCGVRNDRSKWTFTIPDTVIGKGNLRFIYRNVWRTHKNRIDTWDYEVYNKDFTFKPGDTIAINARYLRDNGSWWEGWDGDAYVKEYQPDYVYEYTLKMNGQLLYRYEGSKELAWEWNKDWSDSNNRPTEERFEPWTLYINYQTKNKATEREKSLYEGPALTPVKACDPILAKDINSIYAWIRKAIAMSNRHYSWWDNTNYYAKIPKSIKQQIEEQADFDED